MLLWPEKLYAVSNAARMQDQVLGPMIAAPPQQWPVEQGDESARLLTWLSADGGSDATLEGAVVMVLRFVAGGAAASL